MKMKNIKYLVAASLALGVISCTKQIDEAFPNPNADVRQPIETLMPNIIQNLAASNTANGSLYGSQNDGQYVGRYIQNWATNTSLNQYDMMGQTTTNNTSAASDIGGSHWAALYYGQGQNLNRVIEWGTEEAKWDYVGAAHALRAWAWLCTTDMHGEIIVEEAFNTSLLVFHYDSQERVYEEVKKHARLAMEFLGRSDGNVSEANLASGANYFSLKGNRDKWKKFAAGIMARVYHRTTNKAEYKPDSVVKYADLSMQDNSDNAYVLFEATKLENSNYFGPRRASVAGPLRQTKFIADLMAGRNTMFNGVTDPRIAYLLRENPNDTYRGVIPTKGGSGLAVGDSMNNFFGGTFNETTGSNAGSRYIFKDDSPFPVMTASEIYFMKAEALYLQNKKAQALDAYTTGVSLNIDMLSSIYTSTAIPTNRQITPATKNTYMSNPLVIPDVANFNLSHIMLQKYIAMYGYGTLETWVDMRRYHYIDFEEGTARQVYTDFVPPASNELYVNNNFKLIYRVRPRFNSEFLYNIDALTQIGALALDYHTKRQWFSE